MGKITLPFRSSFRFWPALLCAAVFATPCLAQAPITNGLVARWTGDGNANDSAGHFDGRVSGGLRYMPGPAGQAFQFNGGDAHVDFGPNIGNFGTRDFTIAYWMKTDSKYWHEAFLVKRAQCDGKFRFLEIEMGELGAAGSYPSAGTVRITLEDGGYAPIFYLASSHPVNDGQWHHIVWVRQSTSSGSITCLIYLDGALDNSKDCPEIDLSNASPLIMGHSVCECCDGCRPYIGAAAELQLFSHALSAEEILAIYKAGKPEK
jgi:hypothetical protein